MLEFNGKTLNAGEVAYLRLRVLGFDTDVDGVRKAMCAPCDGKGSHDESRAWFIRECDLVAAGVLASEVEAKAMERVKRAIQSTDEGRVDTA
jgi:hypothetical protein